MNIEGEARGADLKNDWLYVKEKYGEEALKKVEERMAELGYPLKYDEISEMDFYPIGFDALSMLVIKEIFDFSEEDIMEMGENAIRFSIFLKIILRYLPSLKLFAKEANEIWGKHYTVGELEIENDGIERGEMVIKVKDFEIDPVYCPVLKAYFIELLKMMTAKKEIKVKEEKCVFRGDDICQFVLNWEKNN